MKVILVAEEATGAKTIPLILKGGHTLSAVLTTVDDELKNAPIRSKALAANIPLIDVRKVKDPQFSEWVLANNIDVLLNVHSLCIISPQVINALKVGAFNLHPGKLPEYAGLNAPSWSVYHQEPQHWVTLHQITQQVDAGAIIYEACFPIHSSDTALTVSLKCSQFGLPLIQQLLSALLYQPNQLPQKMQDLTKRRYFKRHEIPNNGMIIWKDEANKIDAFIRASNYTPFNSPWGSPKTNLGSRVISIIKAKHSHERCTAPPGIVGYTKNGQIAVATKDHWIIVESILIGEHRLPSDSILTAGVLLK